MKTPFIRQELSSTGLLCPDDTPLRAGGEVCCDATWEADEPAATTEEPPGGFVPYKVKPRSSFKKTI